MAAVPAVWSRECRDGGRILAGADAALSRSLSLRLDIGSRVS
jgi:hypothetical protein